MVSGLWAPPGPRLGGHNYAEFFMIFEMRSFLKKVAKKEHFKNRVPEWSINNILEEAKKVSLK